MFIMTCRATALIKYSKVLLTLRLFADGAFTLVLSMSSKVMSFLRSILRI
jgi:hypothetical protein